jgi:prepilin peptidase CpaA
VHRLAVGCILLCCYGATLGILMLDLASAVQASIAALLVYAAMHDAAMRTIPNWISACIVLLGIAARLLGGDLIASLAAASLLFVGCVFAWSRGWLGGGDAKLAAAFALVPAHGQVVDFILATALAGGGLALMYLALSRVVPRPSPGPRRSLLARAVKAEAWRISRCGPLPYAVAIAVGGIYVLHPPLCIG